MSKGSNRGYQVVESVLPNSISIRPIRVAFAVFGWPIRKTWRHPQNRKYIAYCRWLGSRVVSVLDSGAERPGFKSQSRRCRVTVLGKLFTPIVSLLRVAGVTAGLAESNGSLPPGLWLTSLVDWLPRTGISSGARRSVIEYGFPFIAVVIRDICRIICSYRTNAVNLECIKNLSIRFFCERSDI